MDNKGRTIFAFLTKIVLIGVLFTVLCLLSEPILRNRISFALTIFDKTPQKAEIEESGKFIKDMENIKNRPIPEKSRAPEPSSLLFMLGGISTYLARFARKRFEEFKRFADIVLSVTGLFVLSPVIAFAAFLIKISSPGPAIYRQDRLGKGGRIFRIYKLRTMYQNAEKNTGAVWARANDPRISSVGRILRKTHIDEIPQLINVLKGEMSIVGPRPERPELVSDLKEIISDYEKRLQVKPGITGLAQVWHKYDETIEDVKKKIKYDLLYVRRMCLLTDLRILANTL